MKYPEFQQIIDTMEANGYGYKKEVAEIERRRIGIEEGTLDIPLSEHVKAMIFSLLSDQRVWSDIELHKNELDVIFENYDIEKLKNKAPEALVKEITDIKCGNRKIRKQMNDLKHNIEQLERIERDHGSIDKYYRSPNKVEIVKSLSEGTYKLKWMQVALVCEYLKGVGVNTIKPDSLLKRLLARLGYVQDKEEASPWEAIEICQEIADEYGMSMPMVDTILWQYCAKDKFEVCTDKPECAQCGVHNCPSRTCPSLV